MSVRGRRAHPRESMIWTNGIGMTAARLRKEAMDGVEVDGSRGLRRDVGLRERGGALQDVDGSRGGARCVQAGRDATRSRRTRVAGTAWAAGSDGADGRPGNAGAGGTEGRQGR